MLAIATSDVIDESVVGPDVVATDDDFDVIKSTAVVSFVISVLKQIYVYFKAIIEILTNDVHPRP